MGTKVYILGACLLGVGITAAVVRSHARAAEVNGTAKTLCFSCHGEAFHGGRAPPLAGGRWLRASSNEEAVRIIREGLPDLGMPAFGAALSTPQTTALIAFIRAQRPLQQSPTGEVDQTVIRTQKLAFRIEPFVRGLEVPWSMAFLTPDRLLLTERIGQLRIVDHGALQPPISGLPKVWRRQDGGLLSLALDPHYASNGWIYLSFSEAGKSWGTSMTKIIRGRIKDNRWEDQATVWQADQKFYHRSNEHYGCRLLFIDDKLFFTLGERGNRDSAQDLTDPRGKIHRIEPDGKIPPDNPFVHQPGADPSIWSYGHRNPQGLAYIDETHELWETEHGPMGGDELNLIQPGHNYGWPLVTFGREHTGAIISTFTHKDGMDDPATQWTPSIAVCPVHLSRSEHYPGWRSQLLVGSLALQEFRRVEVRAGKVVDEELLFKHRGRIRDIITGPDGLLYLAIEHQGDEGEIIRLQPVSDSENPALEKRPPPHSSEK